MQKAAQDRRVRKLKLCSDDIKAAVASYWRYTRQCPLIAFECCVGLEWGAGELADVLVVTEDRLLSVIEVKISLSDFRQDKKKNHHEHFSRDTGHLSITHFYFAVPKELANKVAYLCDDLYPYAGVIGCPGISSGQELYLGIEVHRKPRNLKGGIVTDEQIKYIERSQSATLCRLATKVADQNRARRDLEAQLKEYKDMEILKARSSDG